MSAVDFDVLKEIPKIVEILAKFEQDLKDIKEKFNPQCDLTKRAGVMKYLDISNSTISKYIKEGTFKEGYHFHKNLKGKKTIIIYVSGAIEEFKKLRKK